MKNYVVYKHTSPIGKSYIGITNNYRRRCYKHNHDSNKCTAFSNAIKKYGWENFDHKILEDNLSLDQANRLEEFYIKKENTLSPHGYNLRTGGVVSRLSAETKTKLSVINTGKHHSEDAKAKVSEFQKGRIRSHDTRAKMSASAKIRSPEHINKISSALKGRSLSEECKNKLSIANTGKTQSPETRAKITESTKSNPNYKKSREIAAASIMKTIICSDGREFKGAKAASLGTGYSVSAVYKALQGVQEAKKNSFRYKDI